MPVRDVSATLLVLVLIVVPVTLGGCAGKDCVPGPTAAGASPSAMATPLSRLFYIGMTPWPYDDTAKAQEETYAFIREHNDLAVQHYDGGVPWPEAYNRTPYRPNVENEIRYRVGQIKTGQKVYLAVTPISGSRDGLAGYRGEATNMERPGEWNGLSFDDPRVLQAYLNYCRRAIEEYRPDFFAYGIEVNILAQNSPGEFDRYVAMTAKVYATLKKEYPDLPVFLTFSADSYAKDPAGQKAAIERLLPYTDYIAVSTYPFPVYPDPADLPGDWLSQMRDLAPGKPFAIAETGFTAENLTLETRGFTIPGSERWQADYVSWVLDQSDRLGARFVVWFVSGDYDRFWDKMERAGVDELSKLWKDCGVLDGDRRARESLAVWDRWQGRPVRLML